MKKILSLILCMAMLLTAVCSFASCKDDKKKGDDINYDIDLSQKPNLSILMPNSGKSVDAVNSSPNALLIEQLTGYKATYTQLPAADAAKVLNTELMDKKPYDAMKLTKDQFSDLVDQDLLVDITDALPIFAPDLLANISEESWDVVTVDGRIYGIPERASSDNIENPLIFNYDLLLTLNLDVPETLDELTNVLKEMTAYLGRPALTFDRYTPLVHA
ncbi:MAG: extracellular solute-binding protein, partial [Clostridia bacterium]|nr:extracellular solute-binding protein [Clostridia bacterium]